jgi:three-Cys-motif partner protein
MTSYNTDGKVGPWAQEKLGCLRNYLSAYTTILRKQAWCEGFSFIDAFAGAGRAELRKSQEEQSAEELLFAVGAFAAQDEDERTYIEGSPRVALGIEHPFTRYVFIENDPARVSQLRELEREYRKDRRIDIVGGDSCNAIRRLLEDPTINAPRRRGVFFLDPFGMQVNWATIAAIAATKRFEVIVNLPVGTAIQRLLPKTGQFTQLQKERLTEYFGSSEWENVVYEKSGDLFGGQQVSKASDAGSRVTVWYRDRLKKAFGFSAPPRLIRNSRGGHLYYLIFAGPKETGAKIAAHIMRQGESISGSSTARPRRT